MVRHPDGSSTLHDRFLQRGWVQLPWAAEVAVWASAARAAGELALAAPENAHWHHCEGTWFVGVDALPNDAAGTVGGVVFPPRLRQTLADLGLPDLPYHPAQLSVIYPGYPKPRSGESEAAFRYRRDRDAAHLDGLLPVGPARRRMLKEPHGYILGLPLTASDPQASPMVVWEGSHHILGAALRNALIGVAPEKWSVTDLTEVYHTARRQVFETCRRVPVHASPGEAYLVHRLALHGVAPWTAQPDHAGRMIAYLRPQLAGSISDWLAPT